VAFARGTGEPPGVGFVGQAFVDAVRAQAGGRTVGVHGVNYPASGDFADIPGFRRNVVDGFRDEADHVRGVLSVCPNSRMVLGGYSQGAAVTALVTSDAVPADVPADYLPVPLPPEIADQVAAVVLFGKPTGGSVVKYGVPAADIGPRYSGKSLELCAPGDMVCTGDAALWNNTAHGSYTGNGMVPEAAAFAISHL
jgi:cutinase